MKFLLAIFAVVVAVQCLEGDQKARFDALYSKCVKETSVDEALIQRMRQKDLVQDDKLKAYVNCMFQSLGFINDKGDIQLAAIEAKLPKNVNRAAADEVIAKCRGKEVAGEIPQEVAYNVYVCFLKTDVVKLF